MKLMPEEIDAALWITPKQIKKMYKKVEDSVSGIIINDNGD